MDRTLIPTDSPRKQPAPILAAWCLCYGWGLSLLVPTVVLIIPLVPKPRTLMAAMAFLSIVLVIGIAYCIAGQLVRCQRRFSAWFTATLILLTSALQFSMQLNFWGVNMKPPWLVVNALLVILLVTNWRRFGQSTRAVRA